MWEKELVKTDRGEFEIFTQGSGDPLCITHLYSEFNELGYYFADPFTEHFKVYLVNLKEAGGSSKAASEDELSMLESAKDLEAIRDALSINEWAFGGHSTGGMLALVYAIYFPDSLTKMITGGASASKEYMNHEGSIYCLHSPFNKRLKELFTVLKSPGSTKEQRSKAGREWTEMSLHKPEKFDEYFSKPSSGRVVQKRLDYYSYKDLPTYDLREQLPEVSVPSFVYCGKYDSQCPFVFS